jgi:hypothetical protein
MPPTSPLIPASPGYYDAMPDPARVYGVPGAVPDSADYVREPWRGWVLLVRSEMKRERVMAEVGDAIKQWRITSRIVANLDRHPYEAHRTYRSTGAKGGRGLDHPNPVAEALSAAVKSMETPLAVLATRFEVGVPAVSRWATGARRPPAEFVRYVTDQALVRCAKANVALEGLWLAACGDELTEEAIELRLSQLWAEVFDLAAAGVDFSPLAQPLTPGERRRLERFGDMPGNTESIFDWYHATGTAPVGVSLPPKTRVKVATGSPLSEGDREAPTY